MNINWLDPVSDHPINRDLVAWWLALPHQPGWKSIHWLDLMDPLYGHTGTFSTSLSSWVTTSREGGFGAVDFTGASGEWVSFDNSVWGDDDGPISWSFWMNLDAAATMGFGGFGTDSSADRVSVLPTWSDGNLYWDYGNWTGNGRLSTSVSAYFGSWVHVCLTSYGAANAGMSIWINGLEVASKSTSDGPSGVVTWRIAEAFGFRTNGMLDDIRLWKRVLTDNEIVELFHRSSDYNRGLLRQIAVPKLPPVTAGLQPWQQVMAIT